MYQTVFVDSISELSSTPKAQLGTEREENGKLYKYAYTPSAIMPYRAVVLASGVSSFTVSPTTIVPVASGDASFVRGVTSMSIDASSYFWLQTKGFCTVEQAAISGCLSPAKLVVATTSGTVQAYVPASDSAPYVFGQSMAPLGNFSLTIPAYINCLN